MCMCVCMCVCVCVYVCVCVCVLGGATSIQMPFEEASLFGDTLETYWPANLAAV